ncbi:MAG: hypothetical protein ACYC3I_10615 [Gemmataceae bacterium]
MSLKSRIARIENALPSDGEEPALETFLDENKRLGEWLTRQGYPDDPHGTLRAGLRTPENFRIASLEWSARAREEVALYRWFTTWGHIVDIRRRLADRVLPASV